MSSKWFCNSCHSLNARGAKRCYSCGAREDYLGLDALTGVPPEAKPEQPAPAGRGSAGDAIATLASTKGSIEFANAGQGALPRGRTRPKNVAAIVVSALVLVAVIVAAAAVGIGRGSAVGPAARSTPSAAPDSAAPSAVAAASPAWSGHPTKPGVSGAPASPPASAPPSVAPLPTATPRDDKPLPSAPATLAATPFPLGSALPPDELAAPLEHRVRSPSFSGHMDAAVHYQLGSIHGNGHRRCRLLRQECPFAWT